MIPALPPQPFCVYVGGGGSEGFFEHQISGSLLKVAFCQGSGWMKKALPSRDPPSAVSVSSLNVLKLQGPYTSSHCLSHALRPVSEESIPNWGQSPREQTVNSFAVFSKVFFLLFLCSFLAPCLPFLCLTDYCFPPSAPVKDDCSPRSPAHLPRF